MTKFWNKYKNNIWNRATNLLFYMADSSKCPSGERITIRPTNRLVGRLVGRMVMRSPLGQEIWGLIP